MTGLHEPSLYRVLRALTVFGVFTEQPERRFALGPLGPSAANTHAMPWIAAAINELPRTVQTGEPHPAKMLDVMMLILTGGMERTEQQYAQLLQRGGFRLTRIIPTAAPVSVIEAVPTTAHS